MRLLELCLSPDFGGLEMHFRDISTWIARERPDVELVLAVREGTTLDRRLSPLGRPVLRFRGRGRALPPLGVILRARRLARFVKDNAIAVVHVDDVAALVGNPFDECLGHLRTGKPHVAPAEDGVDVEKRGDGTPDSVGELLVEFVGIDASNVIGLVDSHQFAFH